MVRSEVNYFNSMAYPSIAELGLRVERLGKSSVEYEVGVFEVKKQEVRAVARMVHVFVEGETGKPPSEGLSTSQRRDFATLMTAESGHIQSRI